MGDFFGDKKKENEKKIKALQKELKTLEQQRAEIETNKIYDQAFEWRFEFPALLDEEGIFTGFDIIIANPPYIDSETMVRVMPDLRNLYTGKYKTTCGNWDMFIAFIELGIILLKSNGIFCNIIPNKLVAAKYAIELRNLLSKNNILEVRDYSRIDVFTNAAVYPVTIILKKGERIQKSLFSIMDNIIDVRQTNYVDPNLISHQSYWDIFFVDEPVFRLILKMNEFPKLIDSNLEVLGAATVADAYEIKKMIEEQKSEDDTGFKLINSGTIDPFQPLWGIKACRYIKDCYMKPVVPQQKLRNYNTSRYHQSKSHKIVVASMSTRYEACLDIRGEYIAGKSTTILLGDDNDLYCVAGIVNSKLASFWLNIVFNSLKMSGGAINVGKNEIQMLPLPNPLPLWFNDIYLLIDSIMRKRETEPYCDTSKEETAVDLLVYHLYGLTYDEVLIVDPETPITREEYKSNVDL